MARISPRFAIRKERWSLTWLGWLVVVTALAIAVVAGFRGVHDFLAISRPVGARVLVVEGWMPAFAYREVASRFRQGGYAQVLAVAASSEDGAVADGRWRDFGVSKLTRYGVPDTVIATAAYEAVQTDRTYHSAMAVKAWLASQRNAERAIDVATLGPHARRTLILYEKVLGDDVRVGVISLDDFRIDARRWWSTSQGARSVIGEAIGYVYARFLFSTGAYRAVSAPDDADRPLWNNDHAGR